MTTLNELTEESAKKGRDGKTRTLLLVLVIAWLVTLALLIGVGWNAYFVEKQKTRTLAQQIALACESGDFGTGVSEETEDILCKNADRVIENESVSPAVPGPRGPRGYTGLGGANGVDGQDGKDGKNGRVGPRGYSGEDAEDGVDGTPGATGPMGPQGPPGPVGPSGANGKDGAQGPSGVVAVETVGCEGPIVSSISMLYDPVTKTITLTCNG